MSREDAVTGKKPLRGNKRSHAMNATKRKFNLNLQKVKIKKDGQLKNVKATARTIKTLKKQGKLF